MSNNTPNALMSPPRPPTPESPENSHGSRPNDEKDRPVDVALLPNGQMLVLLETVSDDKDGVPKCFVKIY